MCGIGGVVVSEPYGILLQVREALEQRLIHRGPDDAGVSVHHDRGFTIGLGHRRLSIIDLSPLGHQPMSTRDGAFSIVFNGEIFNYRELRAELPERVRAEFRSQTDT